MTPLNFDTIMKDRESQFLLKVTMINLTDVIVLIFSLGSTCESLSRAEEEKAV